MRIQALFCSITKQKVVLTFLDRIMRSYSTKRMTRIWPLALFYNMIDVSAINAFIVWKEINCANATSALGKEECF